MKILEKKRREKGLSQRRVAALAKVSFRTVQLIESGRHDARLSTLQRILNSFGYPSGIVERLFAGILSQPDMSVAMISERIVEKGEASWKIWLFNFIDAFRKSRDVNYVSMPPTVEISQKMRALIASTVEALCDELNMPRPEWCACVSPLKKPWFISGMESLKAAAILESPVHFRKRNIFVLGNFLSRA